MSKWVTTVDELVAIFRDAMCALIPVAERAHMPWKEPYAYDDWDHMCRAIYRSIVIGSIEHADEVGKFISMLDYDWRTNTYEMNSFIGEKNSDGYSGFVCFETESLPFDRCLFVVLDSNLNVIGEKRAAMANAHFLFFCRQHGTQDHKSFDKIAVSI
jgi:hypothetical protein